MEEQRNRITNPAFREGILEALGHKPEELSIDQKWDIIKDVEKNWWFCGGRDTRPNSDAYCPYDTRTWERLWRHQFGEKPMPDASEFCVCRHDDLRYNLYITDGQRVIIIGSKCMYQFLPRIASQVKTKHCELCMKPHKNRSNNYCKDCRITIKKQEEQRVQAEYEQMLRNEAERQALIARQREEIRRRLIEEKRQEEERRARVCECGSLKQPQFPQCFNCYDRKKKEAYNQMTPQQRIATTCSCGKEKKPQFPTCWWCK